MVHWLPVVIGVVVAIGLALGGLFYARSKKTDAKGELGDFIDHGSQGG
jgi:hypothetical protein